MNNQVTTGRKGCAIIPAFMEEARIREVVTRVRQYLPDVVVVDDGSSDRTAEEAAGAGAKLLRHEVNRGKGVALNTGFRYALEHHFDFVVTLDADGQHAPADIPRFLEAFYGTNAPVILGNRMDDPAGMPLLRKLTNYGMSWYLSRFLKQYVPDTQTGYRLYRCDVLRGITVETERYAAESEILLHLAARGVRFASVPITVIYNRSKSKINPFKDTPRFFRMLRQYRRRHREKL